MPGKGTHKWRVIIDGHVVNFGARGFSNYTIHRNRSRMQLYLVRHASRENWKQSGKYTAGFWSRWLLWSQPSLSGAIKETEKALGGKYKIRKGV